MKISFLKIILISLVAFALIVFFLALNIEKRYSTEKIIGKNVDNFELTFLNNDKVFKKQDLTNDKYHLINIWASWCLPCREEHPILMTLQKENKLKIIGINFKDKKLNANNFLRELGNPYDFSLSDKNGTQSILFGVYGIPESMLIDKKHKIIRKFIGPLTVKDSEDIIQLVNEK